MNNTPIQPVNSTKYLGLIFDEKLHWILHIEYFHKSCTKKLNLMRKLSRTSYEADRITLIFI